MVQIMNHSTSVEASWKRQVIGLWIAEPVMLLRRM